MTDTTTETATEATKAPVVETAAAPATGPKYPPNMWSELTSDDWGSLLQDIVTEAEAAAKSGDIGLAKWGRITGALAALLLSKL